MFRYIPFLLIAFWAFVLTAQNTKRMQVRFETTHGKFTVELYDETPLHRENFLHLVRSGYYDGLLFHRVIENFMIQGGDPISRNARPGQELGDGGPAYTIPAEFCVPQLFHVRGTLAAAREGDMENPQRASSGSQFYIVWGQRFNEVELDEVRYRADAQLGVSLSVSDAMRRAYRTQGGTPHLDGQYTVFGRVVKGLRTIGRIQGVQTDENDRPTEDVRILRVYVLE